MLKSPPPRHCRARGGRRRQLLCSWSPHPGLSQPHQGLWHVPVAGGLGAVPGPAALPVGARGKENPGSPTCMRAQSLGWCSDPKGSTRGATGAAAAPAEPPRLEARGRAAPLPANPVRRRLPGAASNL